MRAEPTIPPTSTLGAFEGQEPAKLTARQRRFVEELSTTTNAAEAARRAGYSERCAKVTACRLLTNANLQHALAASRHRQAHRLALRKDDVAAALLQALQMARELSDPAAMVAAAREIGRLLGYYGTAPTKLPLSAEAERLKAKFEAMTDDELLELATGQFAK